MATWADPYTCTDCGRGMSHAGTCSDCLVKNQPVPEKLQKDLQKSGKKGK